MKFVCATLIWEDSALAMSDVLLDLEEPARHAARVETLLNMCNTKPFPAG